MLPRPGDRFPTPATGPHADHEAVIIAVDAHGLHSYDEPRPDELPPTVVVHCSCHATFVLDLPDALVA